MVSPWPGHAAVFYVHRSEGYPDISPPPPRQLLPLPPPQLAVTLWTWNCNDLTLDLTQQTLKQTGLGRSFIMFIDYSLI